MSELGHGVELQTIAQSKAHPFSCLDPSARHATMLCVCSTLSVSPGRGLKSGTCSNPYQLGEPAKLVHLHKKAKIMAILLGQLHQVGAQGFRRARDKFLKVD